MVSSQNLGLIIWDALQDDFDHSQFANNWVRIDNHDHSGTVVGGKWKPSGRGLPIGTSAILPFAITRGLINLEAVGPDQIELRGVGSPQIALEGVHTENIKPEAITDSLVKKETLTIDKFDPGILPLGSVYLWWRYPGDTRVPGSLWEICDGRPWSEISNTLGPGGAPLTNGSIPDMRNHYPFGADLNGSGAPAIGAAGGAATANFAHIHDVRPHVHTVGNHTHGIFSDGGHGHNFVGNQLRSRPNAFEEGVTFKDVFDGNKSNSSQSLYVAGFNSGGADIEAPMSVSGAHSHTGVTGSAGAMATSAEGGATDSRLGTVSLNPPNVAFLFIMRVR